MEQKSAKVVDVYFVCGHVQYHFCSIPGVTSDIKLLYNINQVLLTNCLTDER